MVSRWHRAPRWLLAVVIGALYGTGTAVLHLTRDHGDWSDAVTSGAITGALFGAVMGWSVTIQRDRALALLGDLDDADQALALRAARGGPAPAGPAVREAGSRVVEQRLDVLQDQATLTLLVLGLAILGCGALALASSLWWWLVAVLLAAVLVHTPWQVRRLRRRLAALQDGLWVHDSSN